MKLKKQALFTAADYKPLRL